MPPSLAVGSVGNKRINAQDRRAGMMVVCNMSRVRVLEKLPLRRSDVSPVPNTPL